MKETGTVMQAAAARCKCVNPFVDQPYACPAEAQIIDVFNYIQFSLQNTILIQ